MQKSSKIRDMFQVNSILLYFITKEPKVMKVSCTNLNERGEEFHSLTPPPNSKLFLFFRILQQ